MPFFFTEKSSKPQVTETFIYILTAVSPFKAAGHEYLLETMSAFSIFTYSTTVTRLKKPIEPPHSVNGLYSQCLLLFFFFIFYTDTLRTNIHTHLMLVQLSLWHENVLNDKKPDYH